MPEINRGLKLVKFGMWSGDSYYKPYGDTYRCVYDDNDEVKKIAEAFLRLTVICEFKPEDKCDARFVEYEVLICSYGKITVYYNGAKWRV